MPRCLRQPPVSSQFGVNGSSNGEFRSCWICNSAEKGESLDERDCDMEETLDAEGRGGSGETYMVSVGRK